MYLDCNPETIETDEMVVEKYADLVYKICMTKLHSFDRSSVADACQNVFLNYLKHVGDPKSRGFKDAAHERAWFIRAAINCCTDIYRKGKRRLSNEESADISDIADIAGLEGGGELDGMHGMYEMLEVLPEKIRYAVYLFYVEEYSTAEIAKILKTTGAAVRMRLKRGREILRQKLGGDSFLAKNSDSDKDSGRSEADV